MSEPATEHGAHAAGKGLAALKQKVGPLPLYVWMIAGVAIWWYFSRKNAASATGAPNQQTDPAGNIGAIDPATGYVYGTPEDLAALASNNAGSGGGSGTASGSTGGGTVGGQYPDDESWGRAAINYLVGLGIDPTTANEAIQQFLAGQTLTTAQQADVNEAIQALGAPPQPPGPTGTAPPPVVTPPGPPPGGTVMASNPPSGFTVTAKNATSIGLKWNSVKNATGYTVAYGTTSGSQANKVNVNGSSATTTTVGGLKQNTTYFFEVWADPTKSGGPHAGPISAKTAGSTSTGGGGGGSKPKTYTVVKGDTLSGIAAKLHYPGGWQALYAKNKAAVGPNPNLIHPGLVLQL
jgi:nucleoid-associated protein YgaU